MPNYGLIRVIPGSDLPTENVLKTEIEGVTESELVRHIRHHWELNRTAKIRIEEDLLEDLRARNGRYHPQKLTQIRNQGGSEIYMMITATKQRAAASWIKDIIMPEDGKAWGIEPTTIPDLPPWAEQAVQQRVAQTGMNEQGEQALRVALNTEMNAQAKTSSEAMEDKIADQLEESKWSMMMNAVIDDFTTFSAAVIKGPSVNKVKTLNWQQGFGSIKPIAGDEMMPGFSRVSPFDCYPSPQAENIDDGNFIEHVRFSRGELYNLIGITGYKEDQIREVLTHYAEGLREWLWQDTERNENENHYHWWRDGKNGLIDGLHYWGSVQGRTLEQWDIHVDDPLGEYQIDAILIGRYIIRCEINDDPLARRPYHKACYDPIPGAFWGNSIRYLMNDIQEFCNATARALVNNMAMASGPMMEVNYERLSPLDDELEIYPWKVWQTRGAEIGQGPTITFFQPESNANELLQVYNAFEIKADDATSIPRYSHGNEKVGGAGTTASGLSMLMNSAAKGIKAAIQNYDFGITRPAIEMMYYYNMMTSSDMSIKGDAQVMARGANALLLKDMAQARRNEFLGLTNNELDMGIIGKEGRAEILRSVAKDFEMDGIVPTKEVIRMQMQQAAENPPPSPEQIKQQGDAQIAQIKEEGLAQRHEIDMRYKKDMQEIELQKISEDKAVKMAQINAKKQIDLDKQERDEDMAIRLMREETSRAREAAEIKAEADVEKHALSLELQEKKNEDDAAAATAVTQPALPSAPVPVPAEPMELTVVIDNKSGDIKKKVKINRDADGRADTLDIEQSEN
jgi:hypothetical protein